MVVSFPKEAEKLMEKHKRGTLTHQVCENLKELQKHSVSMIINLKDKKNNTYLSVSTCHLYWGREDFSYHRQIQVKNNFFYFIILFLLFLFYFILFYFIYYFIFILFLFFIIF